MKTLLCSDGSYIIKCPGCGIAHSMKGWVFNGDLEKPTFRPSILSTIPGDDTYRCHSYVTDGKIEFLSDCLHEYKDKTIDLPDVPEAWK